MNIHLHLYNCNTYKMYFGTKLRNSGFTNRDRPIHTEYTNNPLSCFFSFFFSVVAWKEPKRKKRKKKKNREIIVEDKITSKKKGGGEGREREIVFYFFVYRGSKLMSNFKYT